MYAGGARYVQDGETNDQYLKMTPDELAKRFPYVIQATVAWDHDTLQAQRLMRTRVLRQQAVHLPCDL